MLCRNLIEQVKLDTESIDLIIFAGHYCGDTCVCHNCHNTQEHKDLVTQTIAYTRSRNPASFEAKVCFHFWTEHTSKDKLFADPGYLICDSDSQLCGCLSEKEQILKWLNDMKARWVLPYKVGYGISSRAWSPAGSMQLRICPVC